MKYKKLKSLISKIKKEDGCWNCSFNFEDSKLHPCCECKDLNEWEEIDCNPYDYSMNEVY